ncbi:MAG: guanylate kinase [Eubacteriales bacterium]|nr:guanylate kinase [Eubacteriales bacterium]
MGKIYYMMGKSSSGKDTLYQEIARRCPKLRRVVSYTTRAIRQGEQDGVEYHFVDEDRLSELEQAGKVIELRAYNTVHGIWKYFTVDDGQIDLQREDYLMIGTLESYEKMRNYYGADNLVPIYIEVEDGERLLRAINRERKQAQPKYREMCRRFLADEKDFCEENLVRLGIDKRYENTDMETCLGKIIEVIYNGKL